MTKAGAAEAIIACQEALKRLAEIARKKYGMLVVAPVREIGRICFQGAKSLKIGV